MQQISNMSTETLHGSKYIQPFRLQYHQNGVAKVWDCIKQHDSVSILIHHVERDSFIFVNQFRPAVYVDKARKQGFCSGIPGQVDTDRLPGDTGITFEMCAGIVDKEEATLQETAQTEILEECGYDVPLENIEKITKCRNVGLSGSEQTSYYVRVTESMKKTAGGGNPAEGEMIELVEVPVKDSLNFAMDETKDRPTGMVAGILWYHTFKAKHSQTS